MIILVRLLLFQLQNLQLIILYKDFFFRMDKQEVLLAAEVSHFHIFPFRMDKQEVLLAAEVAHEFHQGSDGQYQRWLEALPSLEELEVFHPLFATNEDLTLFSDLLSKVLNLFFHRLVGTSQNFFWDGPLRPHLDAAAQAAGSDVSASPRLTKRLAAARAC